MLTDFAHLSLELAERGDPVLSGPSIGNGVFDGFGGTAFLDLGAASNLDLSASGELRPSATTQTLGGDPPTATANYSAFTMVDKSFVLTNSKALSQAGFYSSLAIAGAEIKVVQLVSGPDPVAFNQVVNHPGGGMVMFPVSYTVPASGNFYLAVKYPSGNIDCRLAARAYYSGDASGSVAFTEDSGNCPVMKAVQITGGYQNMTAETVEIDTPSPPTVALVVLFAKLVDATLNADLVVKVTRDLSHWKTLTMSFSHFRADGSACYTSGETDISDIASGTACKVQWQTLNGKSPRLLASGVLFGTG